MKPIQEPYQFTWHGKTQAIKEAQLSPTRTLKPYPEESKNYYTTKNLYIEGDNLDILKILQTTYYSKIKLIYIDPPYNTKNRFVYNDNYQNHSNWLNMMYPRLKLARNLLTEDGMILISIDEHELPNLLKICEEIFGEYNFIENFIWIKNATKNLSKITSTNHEYILAYAKNKYVLSQKKMFRVLKSGIKEVWNILEKANTNHWSIEKTETVLKKFYKQNPNLKGISYYKYVDYVFNNKTNSKELKAFSLNDLSAPKSTGKGEMYDIIHPITQKVCKHPKRGWRYKKETMMEKINNNMIWFNKDETDVPRVKIYLDDVTTDVMKSYFTDFTDGKIELTKLFDGKVYFDYAKPTTLINRFVELIEDDDIVLDFFSGSATTAHSVIKTNADYNKQCSFIMVQIPEKTEVNSEAYHDGYTNICEIGKERIRRAGNKIVEETGNDELDIGFKVFKLTA